MYNSREIESGRECGEWTNELYLKIEALPYIQKDCDLEKNRNGAGNRYNIKRGSISFVCLEERKPAIIRERASTA
ncbi:Hypothetical predicted protein [Octopus vulgaris]|uniref:Uncharacterized protein n=1 Tax=Octopus vulgaris TaxID=6645 RepID=A0AA36AYT9_OCTVU|nr:Hypothetical predicted protein [Octopus vulgaris]